ncbi:hypothetical protein L3Q82_000604 [Scortum barcoo]|uniref:Uncharacterized protein n=1 Tax=Scortum barcoo TaxID=214431 RepID=A0ACB8WG74_9TELE|nr:hypothetical protein L3Q82_000604 [Scortum barcoo]
MIISPKTLKPQTVLFRQDYMSSVLAVRQKAWMVFFIGTADGQLIKVERVPVSKCSTYTTVQDCWSAQDPYCVWCSSKKSCTFEDDCKDSDWVAIPDDSRQQKMISYKIVMDSTGQKPEIFSITPSIVSFYGRNHAVLSGRNLGGVIRVRIQMDMDCTLLESPVWSNDGVSLMFHIPSIDSKGVVKVCVLLPDGHCHGNTTITYQSSPSCSDIVPNSTWISGKRTMTVRGTHLEFVEGIIHSNTLQDLQEVKLHRNNISQHLTYYTPAAGNAQSSFTSSVSLKVANETLPCPTITYYPDPEFTSFETIRTEDGVLITVQIMYGDKTVTLNLKSSLHLFLLLFLLLIPCIIVVVAIVYRNKQRKLTAKMNKRMEDLELDIRNDIRQGFVDLQTEKTDLMENVGAIPFLDYKHFASRIFFPESESLMKSCIKDMGQDVVKVHLDECCQGLSRLIQDQLFLTSMVHALEEQKTFTIKDKCALASLLTVALHNNLSYLTDVMEALLRALMQQNSNAQPKLLLRRTESIVEKLLTNWMSICLYGFLRESVGQHLFLMVSALTQQTAKGPVDCVTEKALYTLSEDWLLWQAQDFSSLLSKSKRKFLSTFKAKFGFPYNTPIRDVCIEYEKEGTFIPLAEVDASSEVIGEVTMLNTLKHYKVSDGATIKVLSRKTHAPLSPQGSVKDDENFTGKYFHLIDPDVVEDQRKNPERKKLKLKEVHLTKLLSTKVAVHSFVENLFRAIWGLPHSRAPHAVKYFFDFLDTQAENMKITDPDVLHIWKTNSLPLRFWVNILKNPQFVFDIEKTPNLDGCLSVIAQAFMDSFSLSETQLGKHAPTNKLLYAKDIPKFKQEVKAYYKQIRDQSPITDTEFKEFLQESSKKHENEFNEAAALRELYKFIERYFTEYKTNKVRQHFKSPFLWKRINK